jgi:CRP-like cAMP-binding protein
MAFIEIAGYVASGLVLATFCMRTMIPLRVTAIGSNVAFITYGALGGLTPILLLHLVLLPLNIYRTVEVLRLLKRVRRAARGDLSMDWLKPYMKMSTYPPGHVLFRKDEAADRLYMILQGEVRLVETGTVLPPGELLGEIGLFSPNKQRTQTALCETHVELLWIGEQDLAQLCYQHPGMAFYLLRLITARMIANIDRVEKRPLPETAASDVSVQMAARALSS